MNETIKTKLEFIEELMEESSKRDMVYMFMFNWYCTKGAFGSDKALYALENSNCESEMRFQLMKKRDELLEVL